MLFYLTNSTLAMCFRIITNCMSSADEVFQKPTNFYIFFMFVSYGHFKFQLFTIKATFIKQH